MDNIIYSNEVESYLLEIISKDIENIESNIIALMRLACDSSQDLEIMELKDICLCKKYDLYLTWEFIYKDNYIYMELVPSTEDIIMKRMTHVVNPHTNSLMDAIAHYVHELISNMFEASLKCIYDNNNKGNENGTS